MIFFYVSLVTYVSFLVLKYRNAFIELEKDNYDTKKYNNWLKQNLKQILINPELFVGIILIIICLFCNLKVIGISFVIAYMGLFLYALKTKKGKIKINQKIIIRSIVVLIFYILLNIWFNMDYLTYHIQSALIFENAPLYYIITVIIGYLSYYLLLIVNLIVSPFNKSNKTKNKKQTKKHK